MKVLIKNGKLAGGAPRSALEYAKILKRNDHKVIVTGQFQETEKLYKEEGIKVLNFEEYNYKNLINLYKEYKFIKKEKPDLIHSITPEQNVFNKILSNITNTPTLYTQAGGEVDLLVANLLKGEKILVFSKENEYDFLKCNHHFENIYQISNRVEFNLEAKEYLTKGLDEKIVWLLISRLDHTKLSSVEAVIEFFLCTLEYDKNQELIIAGSGNELNFLKEKYCQDNIKFLGWVEQKENLIEKSDLVFGKGRSVIDAVGKMNVSFVISEEKKITRCSLENINSLIDFNMAGRNINESISTEEIKNILIAIRNGDVNNFKLNDLKNIILKAYSVEYLEEKILNLYKEVIKKNSATKDNLLIYLLKLFIFYIKKCKKKLVL